MGQMALPGKEQTTVRTTPTTPMPAVLVGSITPRFPLVARPRPRCLPLGTRVAKVCDLAAQAAAGTGASLTRAAEALNLAALIASDCGMPDLARTLCWQQIEIFRAGGPYDTETAKLALQPAINLARLQLRAGQATAAHQTVITLFDAVKTRSQASIGDKQLDFDDLVSTDADHRKVVEWLWTVVLSDGTRALTTAGRWTDALRHVERYRGIGQRLLEGRQVMIVARCLSDEPAAARELVTESLATEPWERALAACLTTMCLRADGLHTHGSDDMVETYLHLEPTPNLVAFRARLAMAIHDLAPHRSRGSIVTHLVRDVIAAQDGLAGRTILNEAQISARLSPVDRTALARLVRSASLGQTMLPSALLANLQDAIQQATTAASHCCPSPRTVET